MRRSSGVAIAVAVGAVAVVAPIWLSIQLAWNEGMSNEQTRVQSYAVDLVRHGEDTANQIGNALNLLGAAHFPPCSAQDVELMQELAVTSNYLQAVGRISGNQLICTSLSTTQPIEIGPKDLTTDAGVDERFNVWLFKAQSHPLLIVSKGDFAFIVDSTLIQDVPITGSQIAVGIFVPSQANHNLIATHNGNIATSWLRNIPRGSSTTFLDGGNIVSVARAQQFDIAAVAATPIIYVRRQLKPFEFIFVPLGLICALCLAWAVAQISRSYFSLPHALRRAAKSKELIVEYQPIVELPSRRWVGAEALVRWQHGERVYQPDDFIPIAEESGVITHVTALVAETITADLQSVLKIAPDFHIAINLSGRDLLSTQTTEILRSILNTSHAKPSNLRVEATERRFLQDDVSRAMIASIRALGIEVAIDDFGTGYSSLSCVQDLGLDALKIDKSFIETIGTDGATSQVVPHIIDMGHSLQLTMIAEAVETEAQADFLCRRGVRFAQGWLFAKSMNINELCTSLKAQLTDKEPRTQEPEKITV